MTTYDVRTVLFQSTPPRRRRHQKSAGHLNRSDFNPRLREGGDKTSIRNSENEIYFNPRLREGGDILPVIAAPLTGKFQSTPPRRRRLL